MSGSVEALVEKIKPILEQRLWFIGLDRDGTLVPYADLPEDAIVTPELYSLVNQLGSAKHITAAVISARNLQQLITDFSAEVLILAGNYGLEIAFPDNRTFLHPEVAKYAPFLEEAKQRLNGLLTNDLGALLEDNELSLCLHFHLTPTPERVHIHSIIEKVHDQFPQLCFRALPTSYEILPMIEWDKGSALSQIRSMLNSDQKKFLWFYVGDTDSDEPAFRWVNNQDGISIRIGEPGHTEARYCLPNQTMVPEFLNQLLLLRHSK